MAPNNYHACVGDVEQFCEDIEPGSGRVHACLLKHKTVISKECATEEFKTQAIRTRNIRADTEAVRVCNVAMAKFCPDQSPGEGRVWQCLGKHLSDHEMSQPCKEAVKKVQVLMHSEFNLDPGMSKHCRTDAERICDSYVYVADYKDFSSLGDVTTCLINQVGNVSSSDCRADIRRKASERLKSVELDPVRMDMCENDIDEFCNDESKGGGEGKVHTCLSNHFRELSTTCQDIQKTYMVVASSDARVNVPVQRSCQGAQKKFCASAKGAGGIMSCLLAHMHDEGMNTACKEVLLAESKKRAMDYDFNVKLKKACDPVLKTPAAKNLLDKCDRSRENWQTVCLTNNIASITGPGSAACQSEARSVLKLHSSDLRARPGMEGACQQDIERLCDDTEAGAGRWHQCLRKKLNEISDAQCKKMVTKFGTVAGTHATIDYTVRTKCANEMKTFCKDIPAGDSRVMVCLRVKVKEEAEGFSQACSAALGVSATFALPGNNISSRMANFTMTKTDSLNELKKFIYEHEGFTDKWGAGLFVGTACFVAVLAFACSYYILQRKFNKVMYTVAMPDSAC
jgi:Golgi apparatus protein 1